MSLVFQWAALTNLVSGAGTGGKLRQFPHDFMVDEVPAYLPAGTGEHLYVRLRKTGHTTAHMLRELCAQTGVRERDVGVAGLKDRHAVTTQWISLPAKYETRLGAFSLNGVEIVEVSRHSNKLGLGHLQGNQFTVRVREAPGQAARAQDILDELLRSGVPNYFGPQRFGLHGLNAEEGLRVLRGESRLTDPRIKRFLISSVQSAVFNRFVSLRLDRGLFAALLRGDMAKKHATGGVFLVEDAAAESVRAACGEISATGTLFGKKTKPLTLDAGELEQEALATFGLSAQNFASRRGDRRLTRVFPAQASVTPEDDGYSVTFSLPKGSFATSILREIMQVNVDTLESTEPETEEQEVGFGESETAPGSKEETE